MLALEVGEGRFSPPPPLLLLPLDEALLVCSKDFLAGGDGVVVGDFEDT